MADTGFIAQDVQRIFPELVGDMGNGTLGVYYSKFTPYLVKSIQELDANLKFEIFNFKSIFNDQILNVGNVGIGSTSPIANRFAGLDMKLAENGQIIGQQGERITTVEDSLKALQKQVADLADSVQRIAYSSLNAILVTAEGTIPAELSYGVGSEASVSALITNNLITNNSSSSAVLGEASASAVPVTNPPAGGPITNEATASAEATSSAILITNNLITSNSATPSAEASTSAQSSPSAIPVTNNQLPITSNSDVNLATFGNLTVNAGLRVFGQTLLGPTNIAGTATVGNIVMDESSLDAFGILKIQSLARGLIELMVGRITISTTGDIILHSGNLVIETGQIYGNDTMRGAVTIPTGGTYAVVAQAWPTAPKSLVVTPDYATKAWIESLSPVGFVVKVDPAPTTNQKVYWVAIW